MTDIETLKRTAALSGFEISDAELHDMKAEMDEMISFIDSIKHFPGCDDCVISDGIQYSALRADSPQNDTNIPEGLRFVSPGVM